MNEQTPEPHDADDDEAFWARFSLVTQTALAGLTAEDVAARVQWCQATGLHGVSVEEADATGESIRLVWGGRTLAVVARQVFSPEALREGVEGLAFTMLPAAPDDASALTDG